MFSNHFQSRACLIECSFGAGFTRKRRGGGDKFWRSHHHLQKSTKNAREKNTNTKTIVYNEEEGLLVTNPGALIIIVDLISRTYFIVSQKNTMLET